MTDNKEDDKMTNGPEEEYGVCDDCGEYTEDLVLIETAWLCKGCSRMP